MVYFLVLWMSRGVVEALKSSKNDIQWHSMTSNDFQCLPKVIQSDRSATITHTRPNARASNITNTLAVRKPLPITLRHSEQWQNYKGRIQNGRITQVVFERNCAAKFSEDELYKPHEIIRINSPFATDGCRHIPIMICWTLNRPTATGR